VFAILPYYARIAFIIIVLFLRLSPGIRCHKQTNKQLLPAAPRTSDLNDEKIIFLDFLQILE
jgi:hypothetical protein